MSDYRKRDGFHGTPAHKVGEYTHPDGSLWHVVVQPYSLDVVRDGEWSESEPIAREVFDAAVKRVIDERQRKADVEAHGIPVEGTSERVIRVTKTQIVTSSSRYKRDSGRKISGSRWHAAKLPDAVLAEIERRADGRERWDFIEEGRRRAQSSPSELFG